MLKLVLLILSLEAMAGEDAYCDKNDLRYLFAQVLNMDKQIKKLNPKLEELTSGMNDFREQLKNITSTGINGGWSVWGPWSQCSATCDFGTTHRERNCSNPIPENGGLACFGNAYELQLCNQMICPGIDGGWSLWGSWGQCSVTCDYGMTSRERTCSNPAPTRGGLFCPGSTTDFRLCNQALCPATDGEWGAWSAWGTCSATCGTGLQSRNRTCTNPAPGPRGRPCFGDVSDQQLCNIKACDGTGIGFSMYNPQYPSASPVKFLSALYNYNNVYNTTTGEFVCTKRGLYYFQTTLIRHSVSTSSYGSYCYIYKNKSSVNFVYIYYSSSDYPQATGSVILDLQPGDRIYISDCYNIVTLYSYSTFSGFLINTV